MRAMLISPVQTRCRLCRLAASAKGKQEVILNRHTLRVGQPIALVNAFSALWPHLLLDLIDLFWQGKRKLRPAVAPPSLVNLAQVQWIDAAVFPPEARPDVETQPLAR